MTNLAVSQDTWANWTAAGRIPAAGEWCRVTDTGELRFGDGTTAFANLRPIAPASTPEWVNLGPDTLRYVRALFARARVPQKAGEPAQAVRVIDGAGREVFYRTRFDEGD